MLHHRPALAIVDECTSALDEASSDRLYALLCANVESVLSVAHRESVTHFHTHELELARGPDGSQWLLRAL